MLCHFNQAPREDGYSLSELFHRRRVRSYLPTLDDTVNVKKGKAKSELKDLVVKNATKTHKPVRQLQVGDLCYADILTERRHSESKVSAKSLRSAKVEKATISETSPLTVYTSAIPPG